MSKGYQANRVFVVIQTGNRIISACHHAAITMRFNMQLQLFYWRQIPNKGINRNRKWFHLHPKRELKLIRKIFPTDFRSERTKKSFTVLGGIQCKKV